MIDAIVLLDRTGQRIVAGAPIDVGSGAEGDVRAVCGEPDLAVKLHHDPEHARDRVEALLECPAERFVDPRTGHRWLGWPVSALTREDGRFAGYLMPRLDHGAVTLGWALGSAARSKAGLDITWRWLLRAALHLATAVWWAEAHGRAAPDLGAANVFLKRESALATIVDADGIVAFDEAPRSVVEDLLPLELLRDGATVSAGHVGRWALAVQVLSLLLDGDHPWGGFPAAGASEVHGTRENVLQGRCRLREPESFTLPPGTLGLEILPANVAELAVRCFGDGYEAPEQRPTAEQWALALAAADETAVQCEADLRHVHAAELSACPWCALRETRRPFPEIAR